MPKKIIYWECPFCKASFDNENLAEECERNHINIKNCKLSEPPQYDPGESFPCRINLESVDGQKATYVISRWEE